MIALGKFAEGDYIPVVRNLLDRPKGGTEAARQINFFSSAIGGLSNYLEIGIHQGLTFRSVNSRRKVGVDPQPLFRNLSPISKLFKGTSDEFFHQLSQNKESNVKFDFVFIDGLHHSDQVMRDLVNSMLYLTEEGLVLIDDVVPQDFISSIVPQEASYEKRVEHDGKNDGTWHGDVYKVIHLIAKLNESLLSIATISDATNHRTLIWRNMASPNWTDIYAKLNNENFNFSNVTYETVFAEGIPQHFMPMRAQDAFEGLRNRI